MVTAHAEEPNYMAIFYWLTALTVVEVVVVYLPIPQFLTGLMLISMALAKAALVALYFMHLRFERRTLGLIALTPLLLCTLLMFSLLPDLISTPHQTTIAAEEPARASGKAEPAE